MLTVTFYAHASFRLAGDGLAVVTDPYEPGPGGAGFDPIDEPADLVIMSSATDNFHSDPSHIRGDPAVVNALELPPEGASVRGVTIRPFPAMEKLDYDFGRDPDANAMYLFTLGGVRVLHMGDVGNPIPEGQLAQLAGQVDLLLALAGAHATIPLDDLDAAIAAIAPRVVIPMHYYSPRGVLKIEPVDVFTERYPAEQVRQIGGPTITLNPAALPETLQIVVLEQSR
jgi:L-ascorbate metabolism protein UlaG (beta-lactamase superfamily)